MGSEYEVPIKKPRSKPKVVKEWEDEDVFKLIGLVEARTCLWNAVDEGYNNKMSRDNAWQNISDHFNDKYSPADLNAKWTNLRIQYRGYAGKAKTKSGQGAVETPKWKFFNAMNFIDRAKEQQTQPKFEMESDSNSLDCSVTSTPPLSTPRRSQVSNSQSALQIAENMREAFAAMNERNQNALDPNATFANYLLSELKTLSDDAAASVRLKVTFFFLQCLEEIREDPF